MNEPIFYIAFDKCGCPVAAIRVEKAFRGDTAESVANLIRDGYRVEPHDQLPEGWRDDLCSHKDTQRAA
jgi:hypothetical protein